MADETEDDGVEIIVKPDGSILWYRYGVLHRDGGPAVIRPALGGIEFWWYQFGKEHRDDGPAIIRADGSTQWFRDGKCHREDGPAVERADGSKDYWLNGESWSDGPSVIARRKAEQFQAKKNKPPHPQPPI